MTSDKVEWLYKQEKMDPEVFLLGRKIGKAEHLNTYSADKPGGEKGGVESLQRPEQSVRSTQQQTGGATSGQMSAEEIEAQRISIDMQAKMRDDPLFAIRKREEDERRELLRNPVKMKRLTEMLSLVSDKKQSAMSSSSLGRQSTSADGEEDGDSLLKQYLKILQQKNEEKARKAAILLSSGKRDGKNRRETTRRRSSSRSSSSSSGDSLLDGYMNALKEKQVLANKMKAEEDMAEKLAQKAQERKNRERLIPGGGAPDSDDEKSGKSASSSPSPRRNRAGKNQQARRDFNEKRRVASHKDQSPLKRDNIHNEKPQHSRESNSYGSSSRTYRDRKEGGDVGMAQEKGDRREYKNRRSRSRSPTRRYRQRSRSPHSYRHRSRSPEPNLPRNGSKPTAGKSRKLSPASMERRRQEMTMAAQERNVERVANVRRFEEEDHRQLLVEEEQRKGFKSSFLRDVMTDHADRSSVGDRVQRNVFNVQRRGNDISSGGEKFLKR